MGVLAIRSGVDANAQFGPVIAWLEAETGRHFELQTFAHEELFNATADGRVEFVLANPLEIAQVRRLHDAEILATVDRNITGTQFGGVIAVRSDAEIDELDDLRGAEVACVDRELGAGGCNFQLMHLLRHGIDASDLGPITEIPSQDNIVLALLAGDVEVGFVRTGQLERMIDEGLIAGPDLIRVIDAQESDFPYPHTTQLYPEWGFASVATTDAELVERVRELLWSYQPAGDQGTAARVAGFVPPLDYQAIDELIVELRLRSWDVD